MTLLRIGLVVEGPTDLVVFKILLERYFRNKEPDIEVHFIDLQPSIDATSGSPEGGWGMVYRWCLSNPPPFRKTQYFDAGLFAGNMNEKRCDLILFQLDTDICLDLSRCRHGLIPSNSLQNSFERGNYICDVLNLWLWPPATVQDDKHITAPCAQAMETWLIAALGSDESPEDIDDPLLRLAEIHYARQKKPLPAGLKSLEKKVPRYRKLASESAEFIDVIQNRCYWFRTLLSKIEQKA